MGKIKLIVPKDFQAEIRGANGAAYAAKDGEVEIPADDMHDGFWAAGFIVKPEFAATGKDKVKA